jgi:hypothetical protein
MRLIFRIGESWHVLTPRPRSRNWRWVMGSLNSGQLCSIEASYCSKPISGSRYFCESFYGHPCPTSGKNYATANAFGGPSRPASRVAYPTRGMQHSSRNDSTRFRKACIFTTHKALRENTCPIASGDYSTPVSQRSHWHR